MKRNKQNGCVYCSRAQAKEWMDAGLILWPNLGDPTALQCVCFALALLGFNKVRFLYWNRKRDSDGNKIDGFYMPLEFNLEKEHG